MKWCESDDVYEVIARRKWSISHWFSFRNLVQRWSWLCCMWGVNWLWICNIVCISAVVAGQQVWSCSKYIHSFISSLFQEIVDDNWWVFYCPSFYNIQSVMPLTHFCWRLHWRPYIEKCLWCLSTSTLIGHGSIRTGAEGDVGRKTRWSMRRRAVGGGKLPSGTRASWPRT